MGFDLDDIKDFLNKYDGDPSTNPRRGRAGVGRRAGREFAAGLNALGRTIQENFEGGARMAGDALTGLVQYAKEVPQKGFIPILPTAISGDARTGAAYVKSLMGPAGMPLRILDNPESSEFYQQTIDVARHDPERQVVVFNKDIADRAEYNRLGGSLRNKDFGQYVASIQPNGDVIVDDDYDTNRSALWHWNRLSSGQSKEGEPLDPVQRAISGASGLHKKLDQAGWTNPHPFGAPGSVKIGTYRSGR